MSRIIAILVALVLVLAAVIIYRGSEDSNKSLPIDSSKPLAATSFEDWKEYTSEKGGFKVEMPVLPQHAAQNLPEPETNSFRKYDMYVAEKNDGSIFMISLITYPTGDINPELVLNKVLQEMLTANPDNKLKTRSDSSFEKYKTLDFALENTDLVIESRGFVINKTLYLLTYISKKDRYSKEDFDHFLKSFQLINK